MSDPLWIGAGTNGLVGTATIAAATDLFTITAHGLIDGETVTVDALTGGAVGVLVVDGVYFVRDSTANTFGLSLTVAGPLVLFSADGGADVHRYAPQYDARELRRSQRMLLFGGHGDRFGARQGIHPSNLPGISVAGTTWTQHDIAAVVYPGLTSQSGPYLVQKPEESGSLTPADGSNPRLDALDLQIQDDAEDASGFRRARTVYTAGTPAATPSAPAAPANSVRLGTILVPAGGAPPPSVATLGPMTVAAGGIVPVQTAADLPAVGRYEGMAAWLQDSNALTVWDGAGAFTPIASHQSPDAITFTSGGVFEKATVPWAHRYRVRLKGGGASGGGVATTSGTQNAEAGGGGSGEYVELWGSIADLPASVTVTIGTGGAGATAGNNPGNAGGTTSWGSIASAAGGLAGSGGAAVAGGASGTAAGGAGGTGGSGAADLRIPGEQGGSGRVVDGFACKGNFGGGGMLSGSVSSGITTSNGVAGQLYGGGSTGAANGTSQAARGSQAAAGGVLLLELY